jgi:hypothetical protein
VGKIIVLVVVLQAAPAHAIGACEAQKQLDARRVAGMPPGRPPFAIGDSVMLGAARNLARAGFEVDAREGRFMRSALRILAHRARDGLRPPVVVVALGTNFPATPSELRHALRLLTRGQTLALVTPKRSWRAIGIGPIWALNHRHPGRVRVLDWVTRSAPHPEWFYADGTHLRPAGARAYTRLLREAAEPAAS